MEQLSTGYVVALASQLASLCAFLGGFAATFLATLLTLGHRGRVMTVAIGLAVISAVAFVVALVGATTLLSIYHPEAPKMVTRAAGSLPRALMSLGFFVGLLSLLFSIGCSGWTRSRGVGWITTIASAIGTILIVCMVAQVG